MYFHNPPTADLFFQLFSAVFSFFQRFKKSRLSASGLGPWEYITPILDISIISSESLPLHPYLRHPLLSAFICGSEMREILRFVQNDKESGRDIRSAFGKLRMTDRNVCPAGLFPDSGNPGYVCE